MSKSLLLMALLGGTILTPPPVTPLGIYGPDRTHAYATTGDYYVSPTGNDANDGLTWGTAKRNINSSVFAGKKTVVAAGTYRELVSTMGKSGTALSPTTIVRSGTDKVTITGGELLAGAAQCDPSDDYLFGAAKRPYCWKKKVVTSAFFGSDPLCANIMEGSEPLALAGEFGNQPKYPLHFGAYEDWDDAQSVNVVGGKIEGYTAPAMTDPYPASQIAGAIVYQYANPNEVYVTTVESFNPTTKLITVVNKSRVYSGTTTKDRFALRNIPMAVEEGQWFFVISGTDTWIYFWPKNPLNAAGNMTYAARATGLKMGNGGNSSSYVTVEGIDFVQFSSNTGVNTETDENYAIVASGSGAKTNLVIRNFELKNSTKPRARGAGGIYLRNASNCIIEQFSITNIYSQFGIWLSGNGPGGAYANIPSGNLIRLGYMDQVSLSPVRLYTQRQCAIMHCCFGAHIGVEAHANKINAYQGSHQILCWGLNMIGSSGYVTWQYCSEFEACFCFAYGSYVDSDSRSVWDQNGGFPLPVDEYSLPLRDALWLNNHWGLDPQSLTTQRTLRFGSVPNATYKLKNSILAADDNSNIDLTKTTLEKNAVLSGFIRGTNFSAQYQTNLVDAANGDFRIKAGSVIRTTRGNSIAADVAELEAIYTQVDPLWLRRDINYDLIDLSDPPIGPAVNYDVHHVVSMWVDAPVASTDSPTVGATVTFSRGVMVPGENPISHQWFSRPIGSFTWAAISGATSAGYLVAATDVGRYLKRVDTTIGSSISKYMENPVT